MVECEIIKNKGMILVVDDNEQVLNITRRFVEHFGYPVETAKGGQRALEKLEEMSSKGRLPFLVISDIDMPEVNGFDLITKVRGKYTELNFLMTTGNPAHETRLNEMNIPYLLKPYHINELNDKILEYKN